MTIQTGIVQAPYLTEVIEQRFLPMARELGASFDPPIRRIETYIEERIQPPFGWIFPSGDATLVTPRGGGDEIQEYGEVFRIVTGIQDSGFDGKLPQSIRLWLPTAINYFRARRFLIYQAGQGVPRYFHGLTFEGANQIDDNDPSQHVGVDLRFTFAFSIPSTVFPGNH